MEDSLRTDLSEVLQKIQDRIMKETTYFGIRTFKNPLDFWVYQELIYEKQPDVIVEIGNKEGGSTLALAHLLDLCGHGRVIGVDIDHSRISEAVRQHSRISLIQSSANEAFELVQSMISSEERVMVIEDSSHTYEHTLEVLNLYSALIKHGDYFIVEDSICHHGLDVGPNPGPYEAIGEFAKANTDFAIDRDRESFFITWNPRGYLKRVR